MGTAKELNPLDRHTTMKHLGEINRLEMLGVDLSKYTSIENRVTYDPIISKFHRDVHWSILKAHATLAVNRVPDPFILTHIVTTRCNYSCGFCCYADTLNVKTHELDLEEIEHTYATIGHNLNVIFYSGGEPTLHHYLAEIIEAAYRLTPVKTVILITNAWKPELIFQLTHRIKQRCPDLHFTWSVSIDGTKPFNNASRYTQNRGWDAWQNSVDTVEGLKRLRAVFGYQELDVQVCTVCTPENEGNLSEWYHIVKEVLKPDKWALNLMRRSVQMSVNPLPTFAKRRQEASLQPFEQKYIQITERIRQDVLSGELRFLFHTKTRREGSLKSAVDLLSQEEIRRILLAQPSTFCCKAGTIGAFIGSEGEVSGCEEFAYNPLENKCFGKLKDVECDFRRIWHSDTANRYRSMIGTAQECIGCTLEPQRNYPSVLVSVKNLAKAAALSTKIRDV